MTKTKPVSLTNQIFKLEKKVSELYGLLGQRVAELERYKKGYLIMIEHWDSIPDDLKDNLHKELQKENL